MTTVDRAGQATSVDEARDRYRQYLYAGGTPTTEVWSDLQKQYGLNRTQMRSIHHELILTRPDHAQAKQLIIADNLPAAAKEPLHEDLRRMEYLEKVIGDGLKTFLTVGLALREIHDRRFYLRTDRSFEDYLDRRWGMARQSAYQLIQAANVLQNLTRDPVGRPEVLPSSEHQARMLAVLPPDLQRHAWRQIVLETGGVGIKAETIKKKVLMFREAEPIIRKPRSTSETEDPQASPPAVGIFVRRELYDRIFELAMARGMLVEELLEQMISSACSGVF